MSDTAAAPSLDGLQGLRARAQASGRPLVDVLAEVHQMHPREAAGWLAMQFDLPFWDNQALQPQTARLDLWPMARAQAQRAVLLQRADDPSIWVAALTDPFDGDVLAQLEQAAGQAVQQVLCTPEDLHAYLTQQEASLRAVDSLEAMRSDQTEAEQGIEVLSLVSATDAGSPAVRLVNSTLYDALRAGASDVHLESTPMGLAVRYRIDGVLDDVTEIQDRAVAEQTISRLKVLAELDIAERRVPQDGSFQVRAQGRLIDLRVSIMPSIHGEDAVVRILDKQAMIEAHGKLSLEALGFDAVALKTMRALTEAAYGMLLVTGPTGSGKTTTLYAALAETYTGRDKIITIEDPVEYQLPGVLQIPVNEKKGLSFARGLRSILRHDPDKIMVGEIRDRETAEIAVQSALTGHLVLTTVHANNVFDVFGRFTHMGLDPYTLVSALNGIWAQRLVRVNCTHCRQPYLPEAQEFEKLGLDAGQWTDAKFMKGAGCGDCRGTGFRGRRAIAEFLLLDDELREMIIQRLPVRQIKEAARQRGTRTLLEAALDLVRAGATTLEEVRRVTLAQ
ncbi:GspE/PulE family protein [Rhodoferax sp. BAB1]|uniref:GspE/PulE family protein n=1 Tax=Rhodoferax sp. BAB1 TaxID=2741720 RepID=UPI0015752A68|nr:GspE/PulE family protein [Rhodoferax sp. BAB1]QKO21079.1 type II/IV secretion system protein [Rhodoferax sp. BAB1]